MASGTRFAFLALCLFCSSVVLALVVAAEDDGPTGYRRETNAHRLSRGLPPVKPSKLYNTTQTGPHLARRSVQPISGLLVAYPIGSPTPLCYFSTGFTCDPDMGNAAHFAASVGSGAPSPQDILVTAPTSDVLTIEALGAVQGPDVTTNQLFVGYSSFTPTAPNAPPSQEYLVNYETAVWYITSDGTVTANWINPVGTPEGAIIPLTWFTTTGASTYQIQGSDNPSFIASQVGEVQLTLKLV